MMGGNQGLIVAFLFFAKCLLSSSDPVSDQLPDFANTHKTPIGVLTTDNGVPVEYADANSSLNTNLLENAHLMNTITRIVRERIPERVVHARGSGAFGYFEVTHDIRKYCRAKMFDTVGKKTKVAVRFSLTTARPGTPESIRSSRGFAARFYTEEGIHDLVGLNHPIFFIRDILHFSSMIKSQTYNPATNVFDQKMFWDFYSFRPEMTYVNIRIFTDKGTPNGYRHMNCYGIHTFELHNENGIIYYARFTLVTQQGEENLDAETAKRLEGTEPDYATKDLYNAIGNGDYPIWILNIQVMSMDMYKNVSNLFDPFDTTREWSLIEFPMMPVGKLVLNRNPTNYFAEIEQIAFCPGNVVRGIAGRDNLFLGRALAYRDAHNYRLGANLYQIPVNNYKISRVKNYNRDGNFAFNNQAGAPNYYPNSYNGPEPYKDRRYVKREIVQADRYDNYIQASNFYTNVLNETERKTLAERLVASISQTPKQTQDKVVAMFSKVSSDLGARLSRGLNAKA